MADFVLLCKCKKCPTTMELPHFEPLCPFCKTMWDEVKRVDG